MSISVVCFCSRPTVTGSSVLGVTFSGGVMLAADTLGKEEREGGGRRERERERERWRERDGGEEREGLRIERG